MNDTQDPQGTATPEGIETAEKKATVHGAPSPLWFVLILGVVVLLAVLAK